MAERARSWTALPVGPILSAGLVMGLAGDLLLRESGGPGLAFLLLFLVLALLMEWVSHRAGLVLGREARVSIAVGLVLGCAIVFRAAPALQVLAFLGAAAAFAFPTLHAGGPWLRSSGVGEQMEALAGAAGHAALGALRLVVEGFSRGPSAVAGGDTRWRSTAGVLRGLLLALPFLLVFGALFMSADRVFARLVTDFVSVDLEEVVSHVVPIGVFTWLACGFLTGLLTGTRPSWLREKPLPRPSIGILEAGTMLCLIDLLFAAFVAVQFRYLFGGADLVEITPGLTYAEYTREGFAQLAAASALVLPSLLALDWLLRRERRRDEWVFRTLGGLQILLLLVIVASALQRVRAYQDAYGLTESRFYGAVFLLWLTLLSVWFALTVLGGRRARFAFPALASAYALVALLFVLNPDVRIARANLERVATTESDTLDAAYLGSLSADAVPTLIGVVPNLPPEPRCVLAERLLRRWGPARPADWRSWNWSSSRARRVVETEAEGLQATVDAVGCD
jgi:hypothetical protein